MSDDSRAKTRSDARSDQRALVRRSGWFVSAVGDQLRECTVWDESKTGARLVVDAPDLVPDIFHIYMTLDFSSRRQCRVVWRSNKMIGVKFLS